MTIVQALLDVHESGGFDAGWSAILITRAGMDRIK